MKFLENFEEFGSQHLNVLHVNFNEILSKFVQNFR